MPPVDTKYEHIALNEHGAPIIVQPDLPPGAVMKVEELVAEKIAYGWSPEEVHHQHPYLSLGQIHSALAYFYDHQDELEGDLAQRAAQISQRRRDQERDYGSSPLRDRLKAEGLF